MKRSRSPEIHSLSEDAILSRKSDGIFRCGIILAENAEVYSPADCSAKQPTPRILLQEQTTHFMRDSRADARTARADHV